MKPDSCVISGSHRGVQRGIRPFFGSQSIYGGNRAAFEGQASLSPRRHKSDPVDSCQISEYACRFWDELSAWAPRHELLEQIKTLLTAREQFVVEKAAHQNSLIALKRKVTRTPLAEKIWFFAWINGRLLTGFLYALGLFLVSASAGSLSTAIFPLRIEQYQSSVTDLGLMK